MTRNGYGWITTAALSCLVAGASLPGMAQGTVELTPNFTLATSAGTYTLNANLSLNTTGAIVRIQHFPEGTLQSTNTTTLTGNRYSTSFPVPAQGLNRGVLRASSNNSPATTFSTDFHYTVATDKTLKYYPKVTDRMNKVAFTPAAVDLAGANALKRVLIFSSDFFPYLKEIPVGWQLISDLISVAAVTSASNVATFQGNGSLEMRYEDGLLLPAEELNMAVFRWNDASLVWEKLVCQPADTLNDKLTVSIRRTGTYALLSMRSVNDVGSIMMAGQQRIFVAADTLIHSGFIDSLAIATSRAGKEIILTQGFAAGKGSQFYTQLTGTYCVTSSGPASSARTAQTQDSKPSQGAPLDQIHDASFGIYPNPTRGEFTLTYRVGSAGDRPDETGPASPSESKPQSVHIRLLDMQGSVRRIVLNGASKRSGIHEETINISNLPNGMYLLDLKVGNGPHKVLKVAKN